MEQGEMFPAERKAKRDRAMKSAEQHAPEGWTDRAQLAVRTIAKRKATFTSDDVWAAGLDRPPNPRALGPVMMTLARERVIEATPTFVPTTQPSRNCAPVRVWRSLVKP